MTACIFCVFHVGCWLYLHCIDSLHPRVLLTMCSLLSLIQQARRRGDTSVRWMDDKIKLPDDHTGICFASISTPLSFPDYTTHPVLPSVLAGAFKSCRIELPDRVEILKAMLVTRQFQNAASLADSLVKFCGALEELLSPLPVPESSPVHVDARSYVSLPFLQTIVSLSQNHMKEFYTVGAISEDDEEDSQRMVVDGLHMSSMVYSEFSGSTRLSKYHESNGEEDISQLKSLQKQSLEEFSLVLSLKDSVLCSVLPSSRKYPVIVRLISDVFPSCDIDGLLVHEASVREGMAVKARQNREVVESVRESRAASVMQMIREDNFPSGEGTIT